MKSIFIVDDDPEQADLLAFALRCPERTIRAFSHPLHALTALASEAADLLIADLSMPWLDGKDVIATARQRKGELAIFLISGYARGADIAQESGVPFFRKPLDMDSLRAAVDEALSGAGAGAGADAAVK